MSTLPVVAPPGQFGPYTPPNSSPNTVDTIQSELNNPVWLTKFTGIDITGATTSTGMQAALDYCGALEPGGFGTPGYLLMLPNMKVKLPAQTTMWFNYPYFSMSGMSKAVSSFISQNSSFTGYVAAGVLTVVSGSAPAVAAGSSPGASVSAFGQQSFICQSLISGNNYQTNTNIYIGSASAPVTFYIDMFAVNPAVNTGQIQLVLKDFELHGIQNGASAGDGITGTYLTGSNFVQQSVFERLYINTNGKCLNIPNGFGNIFYGCHGWSSQSHTFVVGGGASTIMIGCYGHANGVGKAALRTCNYFMDVKTLTTDGADYGIVASQAYGGTFYVTSSSGAVLTGVACTGTSTQYSNLYVSGANIGSGITVSSGSGTSLTLSGGSYSFSNEMVTLSDCQCTGNVSTSGQLSSVAITGGYLAQLVGKKIVHPSLPDGTIVEYYDAVDGYYQLSNNPSGTITAGVFGLISPFCYDFPGQGFIGTSMVVDNWDCEAFAHNAMWASALFIDGNYGNVEIRSSNLSRVQSTVTADGGSSTAFHSFVRVGGIGNGSYQALAPVVPLRLDLSITGLNGCTPTSGYLAWADTGANFEDVNGVLGSFYIPPVTFTASQSGTTLTVTAAPGSAASPLMTNMWVKGPTGSSVQIAGIGLNGSVPSSGGVGTYLLSSNPGASTGTWTASGTNATDGTHVDVVSPTTGTTLGSTTNFNPAAQYYRGYSSGAFPLATNSTATFSNNEPGVGYKTEMAFRKLYSQVNVYAVLPCTIAGTNVALNVTGYEKVTLTPSTASTYLSATFNTTGTAGSDAGRNAKLIIEAGNGNVTLVNSASGSGTFNLPGAANYTMQANQSAIFERSIGSSQWNLVAFSNGATIPQSAYVASESISGSMNAGAFSYGTLSFSDTNVVASYAASVSGYLQQVMQNTSSASNASTDIILNNDQGTATTNYINFGINSSGYTGSGSYNLANAGYLSTNGGDLVQGTLSNNIIRYIINGSTVDVAQINGAGFSGQIGALTPLPGAFGAVAVTWTAGGALPSSAAWGSVTSNLQGVCVAIVAGSGTSSNLTAVSLNSGATWVAGGNLPATQQWAQVAYGNGVWVAVGSATGGTASTVAAYSTNNGTTWTSVTLPSGIWTGVNYNTAGWAAIASGGTVAAYSTAPTTTWTASTLPASATWSALASGIVVGGALYYIAVSNGSTHAAYSTNGGQTWASSTLPSSNTWSMIAYNSAAMIFDAIAGAGTTSTVGAFCSNGTTWGASTLATSAPWSAVAFGSNFTVAIAGTSASTVSNFSSAGVSWFANTAQSSSTTWSSLCYTGYGFVAVATGGTASQLMLGNPNALSVVQGGNIQFGASPLSCGTFTASTGTFSGLVSANLGLTVAGATLKTPVGTATLAPLTLQSGVNLTTAAAGVVEYDGVVPYLTPSSTMRGVLTTEQYQCLSAAYTLTSQTAAQKLLNASSNGAVTLQIGTYQFECMFELTSMSATSGTFGFALGGTATFTQAWTASAAMTPLATPLSPQLSYNTTANTALATAGTTSAGNAWIKGIIRVTVAGTVIPQVSLSVAAAAIVSTNAYFKVSPMGAAAVTNVGAWS